MDTIPEKNADYDDYSKTVFAGHDIGYYDFYKTDEPNGGPASGTNITTNGVHIGIYTYIVVCSISAVTNTAILLTAISKSARSRSVSWYMYHVIFVTVMQAVVSVVLHGYQKNMSTGLCLLMSFAKLTLLLVNMYTIILMNIEVIRALVGQLSGDCGHIRRYVLSTSATWILSMLFAVSVILLHGKTQTSFKISTCLNFSHVVYMFVLFITSRIPSGIMIVCMFIGSVFYIRGKTNPEGYQEAEDDRTFKTEQFVFFMLWNFLQVLTTCVQVISEETQFSNAAIVRACVFVNFFTPCLSLVHRAVRMVIKTSMVSVANFLLGRTNVSPSSVSNIVALEPIQ